MVTSAVIAAFSFTLFLIVTLRIAILDGPQWRALQTVSGYGAVVSAGVWLALFVLGKIRG